MKEKRNGYERGTADGRKQGSFESKIAIAKKMKAKGMKLEDIAEMTGLSKEEIQNLS